ncbi:MAG: ECF transporter S component [Clostridia bacterium]|nr:ECF transporter S component [Clostridia bacterium]
MDSTKRAKRIRLIVFTALMTALTTALTLASVPLASGYYNFGDVPIFMSACLLGPIPALITGAFGAMLGDVILGYMAYAPFTLVIKALEGVIAGLLFKLIAKAVKKQVPQSIFYCLGSIVGGLIMAIGYFLAEGLLLAEDRWTGGVVNLPFNILQGTISAVLATVLLYACQLKRIFDKIYNRTPQVELQSDASRDATQNNESAQENKTDENNDDLKF